jgi:hypothetical protein
VNKQRAKTKGYSLSCIAAGLKLETRRQSHLRLSISYSERRGRYASVVTNILDTAKSETSEADLDHFPNPRFPVTVLNVLAYRTDGICEYKLREAAGEVGVNMQVPHRQPPTQISSFRKARSKNPQRKPSNLLAIICHYSHGCPKYHELAGSQCLLRSLALWASRQVVSREVLNAIGTGYLWATLNPRPCLSGFFSS